MNTKSVEGGCSAAISPAGQVARPGAPPTLSKVAHSHSHSHSLGGPSPLGPVAAKVVVTLLAVCGVAVVIGLALLWPSSQKADIPLPFQNSAGGAVTTESGHVVSSRTATCGSPSAGAVL